MKGIPVWGGVLALLVLALIAGVLTWLFVGSLFSRGVAIWGLGFIVLVAVAAGLADFFTRESPKGVMGWAQLTNKRSIARLAMSILFGLCTALFAQSFLEPKDSDIIRAGVEDANTKLDTIMVQTGPRGWRAFDNVAGYWGEERQDCRVVYRIVRQDHGLTIELVRKAPDMADYGMTASIVPGGEGDVLRATLRSSSEADEPPGQALVFTYSDDGGGYRRLDWLNESRSNAGALKLEPCEAV